MKNKRIFIMTLLLLLGLGMVLSAVYTPVAQARDVDAILWDEASRPAEGEEAAQPAQAEQTAAALSACPGPGGVANNSCSSKGNSGVSGDTNMLKISGGFYTDNVRYVYLYCGKKVSVVEPPGCSCSGWAYQYTCKRPKTVYISIPCGH
jgi:hypothetical protein